MRTLALALAVLALVLAQAPARADDLVLARTHYDRARALIQLGDHRGAIREFELAFQAAPRPSALYNIAREYRILAESGAVAEMRKAVEFYQRYLEADPKARDRAQVERIVTELRARIEAAEQNAREAPIAPPPGHDPGARPAAGADPGGRPAVAPTDPAARPATAPPSAPTSPGQATAGPTAPTALAPSAPDDVSARRHSLGVGLLIAGSVITLGGAGLLGWGGVTWSDAQSHTVLDDRHRIESSAISQFVAGGIVAAVGVAALITGGVLVAGPAREPARAAWRILPTVGGVVAFGRF